MRRVALLLPLLAGCAEIADRSSDVFSGTDGILRIVYAVLLIALVWGGVSVAQQGGWLKTLRNIGLIFLAFAVLIVGYTFKDDVNGVWSRVKAELLPGSPQNLGNGTVVLRRETRSGQFETTGLVNGIRTNFLVDTGASFVVLPFDDAERIGYTENDLSYVMQVSTANGTTFVAPIRLNAIKVGDIVVNDVRAAVSRPGELDQGLLGMSFLDRLDSYSVSGDVMTLER